MKLGIKDLSGETLRPYVGQRLTFQRPAGQEHITGGRVELELQRVVVNDATVKAEEAHPENYPRRQRVPFSALFVLPADAKPLGAGLHQLKHPDFEEEEWFLTRVLVPGGEGSRAYYEAVFG